MYNQAHFLLLVVPSEATVCPALCETAEFPSIHPPRLLIMMFRSTLTELNNSFKPNLIEKS